jgi:hypothetical protein
MAKRKRAKSDLQNTENYKLSNTNPTKTEGELRCPGKVSSSCFTSDIFGITLVTNPVIMHK